MKKTIILAVLILMVFAASAKEGRFIANKIINEVTGTIIFDDVRDNHNIMVASTPSYYDNDLIKMTIRNVIFDYSDIKTIQNWTLDKDRKIQTALLINSSVLLITFDEAKNHLFFTWKITTDRVIPKTNPEPSNTN